MMQTVPAPADAGVTMPTKDDGSSWPHGMLYQDGDTLTLAVADTAGELLAVLIDDYPATGGPDEDLIEVDAARIDYGVRLAQGVQESWLATAVTEQGLDLGGVDERVVDAWFRSKDTGVDLGGAPWEQPVPLVCLDMAYAPFTDVPAPTGDVVWVRVRTETDLLASMDALGLIVALRPETVDA